MSSKSPRPKSIKRRSTSRPSTPLTRRRVQASREKKRERDARYRENNRERIKEYLHNHYLDNLPDELNAKLVRKYGITFDEYAQMEEDQDWLCAICKQSSTQILCVDHDHETGKVRGLLCNNCNKGIGLLGDTLERLRSAAAYLSGAHKERTRAKAKVKAGGAGIPHSGRVCGDTYVYSF